MTRQLLLVATLVLACRAPDATVSPSPPGIPVWLDVDPAVRRGGHEPDDGLALLQAFHSPELDIVGVSVVYGNSPLEIGDPIAREIVSRFGPEELAVYSGASGAEELGVETDASQALAEALGESPMSILTLGPVTNVATVLTNDPELGDRIDRIIAVAGRRPGQRFTLGEGGTPLMDFNFELDPAGFQVLLDSGVPITLAPFEISSKTPLTEEQIERFATVPPIADFYLEPLRDYVDWYDERFAIRAIFPFDTLAVAYVTSPEWIQCEELPVDIQTLPDDVRPGEEKPYLLVSNELASASRVAYCHSADVRFTDDLMRRMLGGLPMEK